MKGHNQVWISGNVGGNINIGTTPDKKPACSFSVATESINHGTTWVRVNAYGDVASRCSQRLMHGAYLSIVGELMNRRGRTGELTEVRAKDVIFLSTEGRKDKEVIDGQEAEAKRREQEVLPGVRKQ